MSWSRPPRALRTARLDTIALVPASRVADNGCASVLQLSKKD